MHFSTLILGSAAVVNALPQRIEERQSPFGLLKFLEKVEETTAQRAEEEAEANADDAEFLKGLCEPKTFKTGDEANAFLDHSRAVWEIDDWIYRYGYDDWLERFDKEEYNVTGRRSTGDCAHIFGTDTCSLGPDIDCPGYYQNDDFRYQQKSGYWIFQIVRNVFQKSEMMMSRLTFDTINTSLNIKAIKDDFGVVNGDDKTLTWVKFALGIGSVLAGPTPVGPVYGLAASLATNAISGFENAQQKKGEKTDEKDMQVALSKIFEGTVNELDAQLRKAFGLQRHTSEEMPHFRPNHKAQIERYPETLVDSEGNEEETMVPPDEKLVMPYGVGKYATVFGIGLKTSVGTFLNNGFWLIDGAQRAVQDFMKEGGLNIRRKMVDMQLRKSEYHLVAQKDLTQETCRQGEGYVWMAAREGGKEYCFHMMKIHYDSQGRKADSPKEDWYKKLANHGWKDDEGNSQLGVYYNHLLDCHFGKGHGAEMDLDQPVKFGEVPTCFFNVKVLTYAYKSSAEYCLVYCEPFTLGTLE